MRAGSKIVALAVAALAAASVPALGSEAGRGQKLLDQVTAGHRTCANLTAAELELIGESVMGRAFQSDAAHEQMNRLMIVMMGSSGERQMHQALGRRAAGCSGQTNVPGYGQMMGAMGSMMGMMGAAAGPSDGAGMMGATGPSRMSSLASRDDNSWDAADTAMVAMMALLLVLLVLGFTLFRPTRRRGARANRPMPEV